MVAAGCDIVLYCSGDLAEMRDVAEASPALAGAAARRADTALALRKVQAFDMAEARSRFSSLIGLATTGSALA